MNGKNKDNESFKNQYENNHDMINVSNSSAPYSNLPSTVQNNNYGTSFSNPYTENDSKDNL